MQYKLNEGNIDAVVKEADAYLVKRNTEKKEASGIIVATGQPKAALRF
jgi:hypothetical protein